MPVTVVQAWDDGVVEDARLTALLRKHKARAAFNLNPGFYRSERSFGWMDGDREVIRLGLCELREVYAGFEIAAHSMTHPRLTDLDDRALRAEIRDSKAWLEDFFRQPVSGFCYPFNDYDDRVVGEVRAAGFRYARGTGPADTAYPPEDPFRFAPSCHVLDPSFEARYRRARQRNGVFFFWGHAYEMRSDAMWRKLEGKFEAISADPEAVWRTPGELFADPVWQWRP